MIVNDKKFSPLFWTQLLGALSDNVLKNALVVMATFKGITVAGLDTGSFAALASGLFILPFFLFSPIAGQLADKLERSRLVRLTKIWELVIMIVASFGFYYSSAPLLLAVLFLAGAQSTLFGPLKYSMLPDLVSEETLIEANAFVELGTFLAILVGTIGGGVMITLPGGEWWIISSLIIISMLGLYASFQIPATSVACPDLKIQINPVPVLTENFLILRKSKAIFNSILGISWFWFFGAAVLSILPVYCKDFLGVGEHVVTCFLAMFTLGIGIGSVACEKLSFQRVEIGLVPLGSLGMTVFLIDLYFARPGWAVDPANLLSLNSFLSTSIGPRLLVDFFLMSFFGGFFILPLYTLLQERSERESRSRVIAGNNIMNALFMVVSSIVIMAAHKLELSYSQIFMGLAVLNLLVSVYIYSIVPEFTLRFLSWVLARALYRIEILSERSIPKEGAAVLVCNHVSYIDWLIISALVRRPVRFIMYYKFFEIPVLKYFMKQAKVIPIAGTKEDPGILQSAFEAVSRELRDGEIVCIFPEGKITRDGEIDGFRTGIEKILARDPVPVVPMALKGLWGSWFSLKGGRAILKTPRRWMAKVQLVVGEPVPATQASAEKLGQTVKGLLNTKS
jgi:1-acyl-sn-glycerol-3-phosphate acyltransferase